MEELIKLIEWQRQYGYDDIELISTLLVGILENVESFGGKLKYNHIEIGWNNTNRTILYKYVHKGIMLKYQKTWQNYHYVDTFTCRLCIKDQYNKDKYTTKLKFIVPNEQTAILYLSKLYTLSDLLIGRPQRKHYIPKVKDRCKLKEINDFKHRKGSYKKVAAGDRSEYINDIHSSNRTDERIKLNKLKLNPTDYYNFNFATKLTKGFSDYGGRTNYVMWSPWVINYREGCWQYDLEFYNKLKRK